MTKENKLKIGLALNAIATMSDKETFDKIKDKLIEIENIVSQEPTTNDGVLNQIAEKQYSLRESIKVWNDTISKNGYIN